MLRTLHSHMDSVSLEDVTQGLRACFKVLSKIQMPVAYMDVEAGAQTEDVELQSLEEESKKTQVRHFTVCSNVFSFYNIFDVRLFLVSILLYLGYREGRRERRQCSPG